MVHRPTRRMQQRRHPAIAVAPVLLGQGDDVLGERLLVICPARHLALRRPVLPEHAAHPPLGDVQHLFHLVDAAPPPCGAQKFPRARSEEHTSELQSLMRISYAGFCLKKKHMRKTTEYTTHSNIDNTNTKLFIYHKTRIKARS